MQRLIPVFEVMSSNRLRDWHWEKMAELVGSNLSRELYPLILLQYC